MNVKTNATSLAELDIALAELREVGAGAAEYRREGWCMARGIQSLQVCIDRLAMFDSYGMYAEEYPTAWGKIRGLRYDKRIDHSTHSLFPFQGKLEPRIARACVNLGIGGEAWVEGDSNPVVVDPFCGSGTILLEANLMGFPVVGGDIDPFAVWLTETKLSADSKEFERRIKKLGAQGSILAQRSVFPPSAAAVLVQVNTAIETLRSVDRVAAIVTSPPYYDAIDYNSRHAEIRNVLGLDPPGERTMGVDVPIDHYERSIVNVSRAMFEALAPRGKAVIIAGAYRGVDVPKLYEDALRAYGMGPIIRLRRPYRTATLDVAEDVIIVMEKP